MKKIFLYTICFLFFINTNAQETVYPAKPQTETIILTNATIHIGNGNVINNGNVVFANGKITEVANTTSTNGKIIDCKGKHIYPGLILCASQVGLVEVPSVRATHDDAEIGDINASIRSLVSYNTDSKVIGTLKQSGIEIANIVPDGGLISGASSVVQLDAWNWEDAAYKTDGAIHFRMPSLLARPRGRGAFAGGPQRSPEETVKEALSQIEKVKIFLREAKAYNALTTHTNTNLKYQAVSGLFNKKQKLFIHCNIVKEMLIAIDFAKEFGCDVVIVGGVDSWQIADILKQNNIAVVLSQMHSLPVMVDDDIDQPFKTPAVLQKAGVLYAINDEDENTRSRNLAFNAGTAAANGLTKEEALQAITLNAAKILGIDEKTGSIETGKDANLVICDGDILDMKTNIINTQFIQGRWIDLNNKQKILFERYKYKYGIK